jgi:hypothetical protein
MSSLYIVRVHHLSERDMLCFAIVCAIYYFIGLPAAFFFYVTITILALRRLGKDIEELGFQNPKPWHVEKAEWIRELNERYTP